MSEKDNKNPVTGDTQPTDAAQAAPADATPEKPWSEMTRAERKAAKKAKQKQKSLGRNILEWALTIIGALAIAFFVRGMVFEPVKVDGHSMDNTLADGEIMFVGKWEYCSLWLSNPFADAEGQENCAKWTLFGEPQRFDVVICHYPGRGSTNFVKRIVGLPGDTVRIYEGYLYVNGVKYDEPYISDEYRIIDRSNGWYFPEVTVPEGCYFVMGDHRNNSNDSRSIGPIERSYIIGRVMQVVYPFSEWRAIPSGGTWTPSAE